MSKPNKTLDRVVSISLLSLQLFFLVIVILAIITPVVLQLYTYTFTGTGGQMFLGVSVLLSLFLGFRVYKGIKAKSFKKLQFDFTSPKEGIISILIVSACLVYLGYLSIVGIIPFGRYFLSHLDDKQIEQATEKEIRDFAKAHPDVQVERLVLWEGDSTDTISISGKGKIDLWYRKGGPPRIEWITLSSGKAYGTTFHCETNENGKREYAYDYPMVVTKDDPLGKLFSFEVNTLDDLLIHFDHLVKTIETFPVLKETVHLTDRTGDRDFVKDPDPKYAFKTSFDEKVICYYYVKVTDSQGNLLKE